jgi:hypothetical protein
MGWTYRMHQGDKKHIKLFFFGILVSEENKPLAETRHRWEDNIKMDHKDMGCEGVDWMYWGRGAESTLISLRTITAENGHI